MSAKIIAIAHAKGGVGKTTTTVNLGIGLARLGQRVLMIDVDPQGDLTKCLGLTGREELVNTLATALFAVMEEKEDPGRACIRSHREGVDFIPSNQELSAAETALSETFSRETVLKAFLNQFRADYDYILLDCRPSLGLSVINALTAADSILIPVQAEELAADDLDELFRVIGRIKRHLNPHLDVEGILLTMVSSRTNLSSRIVAKIREEFGELVPVFNAEIPRSIRVGEMPRTGGSIYASEPRGKVAQAYMKLTEEVLGDAVKAG